MGKLNTLWEKIKKWFKETALPWLKKGAIQIINVLVILFLYGQLDNLLNGQEIHLALVTTIAGLWAFVLAGYWLFWKLFGFDKVWVSLVKQWKKKREMRKY